MPSYRFKCNKCGFVYDHYCSVNQIESYEPQCKVQSCKSKDLGRCYKKITMQGDLPTKTYYNPNNDRYDLTIEEIKREEKNGYRYANSEDFMLEAKKGKERIKKEKEQKTSDFVDSLCDEIFH